MMKITTVLTAAAGIAVGYVLGSRAGRGRFEEIKLQAQKIATDPEVRQKVAGFPSQVRENLPKAQAVVADAIKVATDKVQDITGRTSERTPPDPSTSYPTTGDKPEA